MGTIGRTATMASDLPADCGGSSIETSRYFTNRQTRSDSSRDVLSLSTNRTMRLTIRAPNLMQRLSELPTVPNVTLLDRRKTKPQPWPHDSTTFTKQIYIRWCCIDLSNAPDLPDISNRVGSVKHFLTSFSDYSRGESRSSRFFTICVDDHGSS